MPKINAINNKSEELTIDPGASGDSFVQFDINGTGEFRIGVDDDASDAFKISQGSALGTNDTFIIESTGERTMPLQPAFLAKRSSDLTNATGDGTAVDPVIFDSEIFDQNGDYNNSTGYFTAPVDGIYVFSHGIAAEDLTSSHTRFLTRILSSNHSFFCLDCNGAVVRDTNGDIYFSYSIICELDASDTVRAWFTVYNDTKVVDIIGDGTTEKLSWFGGYLAC